MYTHVACINCLLYIFLHVVYIVYLLHFAIYIYLLVHSNTHSTYLAKPATKPPLDPLGPSCRLTLEAIIGNGQIHWVLKHVWISFQQHELPFRACTLPSSSGSFFAFQNVCGSLFIFIPHCTWPTFWSSGFESRATEFQTPRCRRVCPCKGYSKYKPHFGRVHR